MPEAQGQGLDLAQNLPQQRREWRIERAAWGLLAALALAALLGLLGPGPLSTATAGAADTSLRLHYQRFLRHRAPSVLRIQVRPAATGATEIWLARELVAHIEIKHIDPAPLAVGADAERFRYRFRLHGTQPVELRFHFEAAAFGRLPLQLGVSDGPALHARSWVFP